MQVLWRKHPGVLISGLGVSGGAGAWWTQSDEEKRRLKGLAASTHRIARLVGTVAVMSTDYAYHLYVQDKVFRDELDKSRQKLRVFQDKQEALHLELFALQNNPAITPTALEEEKSLLLRQIRENEDALDAQSDIVTEIVKDSKERYKTIHTRNAIRLRDLCATNKGLYIKLGQHLAMLDYVMPEDYQIILRDLLANNPVSPLDTVHRVFLEEVGIPLEEAFSSFNPVPLASASLAQVHIATDKEKPSIKYAVKIQHEGLREGSALDRVVITWLIDQLPRLFPSFQFQFLAREMNLNLPLELDFRVEAQNIARTSECLHDLIIAGDVALPSVQPALSASRVLTMSFETGVYLTQKSQIVDVWGLQPAQISQTISRVFCTQIFRSGFVHCDPHEANLLVRPHPKTAGRAQIVLLDHGLYRALDDSFRRNYLRLWQALLLRDEKHIEVYCRKLNAGDMYSLLAAMLLLKPWNDIVQHNDEDRFAHKDKSAQTVLLQAYASQYFEEILLMLGHVPSDLLLLFKTNDCLRHLDAVLRTPVQSTKVLAEVVAEVLLQEETADLAQHNRSGSVTQMWQYLQVWTQWSHLQTRVWTLWALSQLLALYTAGDKIEAKIESPQKIEAVETMAERTVHSQ